VVTISLSARSLAAARAVDPEVSVAAVRAAVEVAVQERTREVLGPSSRTGLDPRGERDV
jgi:hypothetical protein